MEILLLQDVRCENKVAVLITDGMPFVEEILPKEIAMDKTREAPKNVCFQLIIIQPSFPFQLRRYDIDLVALGYGEISGSISPT